jgi:hypothetical protein
MRGFLMIETAPALSEQRAGCKREKHLRAGSFPFLANATNGKELGLKLSLPPLYQHGLLPARWS